LIYEKIYSIEKYVGYNPMKDYFFPMAVQDPAVLHVVLFSAKSFVVPSSGYCDTPQALLHLRECIRLVNGRLRSSPPIVNDSTIAIIATMAFVEVSL
jgi:hypothetical protein